jgi:hypothetical protein
MQAIQFLYKPQQRQMRFHVTTTDPSQWADEVLYGGAAGGGKSAAIVGDAFRNAVKYPGINILILRRTLPELEGSILLRMMAWFPREVCKYKEQKKTWEFVNDSRINLGFCEHEKDVYRYQGKEFDIIYIDELTHFSYEQFIYLKSRNRSANQKILKMGFRPQMKLTTNPGGVGHVWVKRRYIDIGEWEQVHEVQEVNENDEPIRVNGKPVTTNRIFIPAKLQDNRYIDVDYEAKLMAMPEALRKQLLDGDWDTLDGMFFDTFRRSVHVVEPFEIPSDWKKFRMMDEGYDPDPFVCLWGALDGKGNLYIYRELTAKKLITSAQVEAVVAATPRGEKIDYTVGDTSFWNRSKATGEAPFEVFMRGGINPFMQATKERAEQAVAIYGEKEDCGQQLARIDSTQLGTTRKTSKERTCVE